MSPTDHFDNDSRNWTLADIYNDLGSRQDIARVLNVTEYRVHKWLVFRDRIKSPLPVRRISHIDVYSMQQWRDWFKQWEDKHKNDSRTQNTKTHGSGESFWAYFDKHNDDV